MRPGIQRLGAIARVAARQGFAARGGALARAAFFFVILFIFSRLWFVMAGQGKLGELGPGAFIWYLALTEFVALGAPLLYLQIEEDVRRGDIAYRLSRPVSYLATKLAEGAGECLPRLTFLLVLGVPLAWLLAGELPDVRGLLLALPLLLLSLGVLILFQAAIGLSAFWLQDAAPVHWIWQKFSFVFGGLLFPLEIYPGWLQEVAAWTPFSSLYYGCGRMALGFDPAQAGWTALKIVGWGAFFFVVLVGIFRRGLRVLDVNGG